MKRALALVVLLIVLIVASGCAQNPSGSPPTGNVVVASNQAPAPEVRDWPVYQGDLSKDQCPSPAVCLPKEDADYRCKPSSWCGRNGDLKVAGNKPYCCKPR